MSPPQLQCAAIKISLYSLLLLFASTSANAQGTGELMNSISYCTSQLLTEQTAKSTSTIYLCDKSKQLPVASPNAKLRSGRNQTFDPIIASQHTSN